ncbi:aldo/keto reductase [Glycomyces sp. TRM65418]|uniref:aldo/keto reductase n=1 Tax=Glycomyces sp. TRM65418 TaxID=2867006 RepID=UPI001CE6D3C8|nr:aldo/keto reductase [Glycomyces sp. TRM65418]MCC3764475.1 aldo/keto reductase [Glycomyces sp. TRM65418]QZD54148.1 aldo/keto reductase [Glycomyces sp. TRM65418]
MTTTPPFGPVVLGSMTFGDTVDETAAAEILALAAEAGVRMIDTANAYAGGETERMLNRLLAADPDRFLIATKAGMPHPDADGRPLLSPAALRASLEGSLKRLGRDRVDLFYLHQPDRETPIEQTLTAVGELLAEGVIGAYGVSNYAAWQIAQIQATADRLVIARPVVAQQLYNLVARGIEAEYAEFAQSTGVSTMVYNPLGGGMLVGRHRFAERPTEGRFVTSRLATMYTDRYWNEQLFAAIEALARIAEDAGISLVELSLRWLVGKPVTDAVLVGGSAPHQIDSNLALLAKGPLPQDVVAACDEVGRTLRGPMPAYNR